MYFINKELYFPPLEETSIEGIIAVGGDLSTERLLLAYQNGIFPWYDPSEPILWWAPQDRMVVNPHSYKAPKSLRKIIRENVFEVTFNQEFDAVIKNCQTVRRNQEEGTWISEEIITAYTKLHQLGYAKSVEVWQNNELVGGLYGTDLGHVFCGESMFSKVSNASKVGFVSLIEKLKSENYKLLDCQLHNDHLEKLGAFEIPRELFMKILKN